MVSDVKLNQSVSTGAHHYITASLITDHLI